ncbi:MULTISPECIES: hypothetical protein [Gordonibacter]|uniref:Uncharacterized protein n=2 Tax=Gordonibacter TaxID=644652 RepID=A0ABT7DUL5_9ACTN|nr:hypothetical protein [Gordonibacter sp. KGMB12511]MDJ1651800.1 hypothetical protein [Gordonibacter sp. KGMB12511]HIW75665.1 hypothetical protein [Candidatus Gordonibacter avicola]
MPSFSTCPKETLDAIHALFSALGKPTELGITDQAALCDDLQFGSNFHPVFALTEHFQAHDSGNKGYTYNSSRGDHLSVPGYTEEGEVVVMDVSFHKGETYLRLNLFPSEPQEVHDALFELLRKLETR